MRVRTVNPKECTVLYEPCGSAMTPEVAKRPATKAIVICMLLKWLRLTDEAVDCC